MFNKNDLKIAIGSLIVFGLIAYLIVRAGL